MHARPPARRGEVNGQSQRRAPARRGAAARSGLERARRVGLSLAWPNNTKDVGTPVRVQREASKEGSSAARARCQHLSCLLAFLYHSRDILGS
eukprot:5429077-Pleurochrysis_carterae.AAC.4